MHVRNGHRQFKANDLNGLIAADIRRTLARKSEGKVIGRCEAISLSLGCQCAQQATTVVEGRRVCTQHARAPSFVVPSRFSPIIDKLRLLSDMDDDFAAELREMLAERNT